MKNALIIANIVLFLQSCRVKVSKNKVERLGGLGGLGGWPMYPSKATILASIPDKSGIVSEPG